MGSYKARPLITAAYPSNAQYFRVFMDRLLSDRVGLHLGSNASLGMLVGASYMLVFLAGYGLRAFISWRRRKRFR